MNEITISTGNAIIRVLRGYGIDTVFGIPGTHNLEFYRPLQELGIRAVTARHEQGAGYGADGWSLRTGLPGVVITTSGPGLLNALSAAGTAFCESRPMLLLSPGPARGAEFADVGTLHETKDQLAAAAAICAKATRVNSLAEALDAVHAAFAYFQTGRPRPIYIEVPLDLLEEEHPVKLAALSPRELPSRQAADPGAVTAAAAALANAARPVILAGGGSRGAAPLVQQLAEFLAAPVVTTLNAKGVLSERHPLALGSQLRLAAAREVARTADVLLVVGSKLGEAELWVSALEAAGQVIRMDISAEQLHKNQRANLTLLGDAALTLEALLQELTENHTPATAQIREGRENFVAATRAAIAKENTESSPANAIIAREIAGALPADAIITADSSQIDYMGLLNVLQVDAPNTALYMATYATLGYGLPAAIGAKIATPSRPVFTVLGDGALAFALQEFITAAEQQLDLTVILVENGGYEEIKQNEISLGISPIGVELFQPDWVGIVRACGGDGEVVTNLAELGGAITRAIRAGGIRIIHIKQSELELGDEAA